MATVEEAIKNALDILASKGKSVVLKSEQEAAVKALLEGQDVLAVLPTGFGKSMIFTVFGLAVTVREKSRVDSTTVLVICPLKSIISDQICQLEGITSAAEMTNENLDEIVKEPPGFIYCSAEQALDGRFLAALKDTKGKLHQQVAAVVVDESHTVETWTGKRSKGKTDTAFREAYGRLSTLRSMCKTGIPLLAITGTADTVTQKNIAELLSMSTNKLNLFVSPNRKNLKFEVVKVKKNHLMDQLLWLVEEIKEKGPATPQTVIFCCSLKDISTIVNWFLVKLDKYSFYPTTSVKREHCLIGIYHSITLDSCKERISKDLKGNGLTRVVLATTALSMGVNFPQIRNVIMYGPPRSILDFHQEAGRAGRDLLPANVYLYYHGQQSSHCEEQVKDFLRSTGCLRVAAYQSLDKDIQPLLPNHDCCTVCEPLCDCGTSSCTANLSNPSSESEREEDENIRHVPPEDKQLLKEALLELQGSAEASTMLPFGGTHGFSSQLIDEVLANCNKIFCFDDVLKFVPVFSKKHAFLIFEIFNDIFDDCEDFALEDISTDVSQALGATNACSYLEFLISSDFEEVDLADTPDIDVL